MFEYQHVKCPKCDTIIHKDSPQHIDEYENECPNITKFSPLNVIASWGICNIASLNVFEFSKSNDGILVAINDNKPIWCEIDSFEDEDWKDKELEDKYNQGIDFNGTIYFLDECMRI